MKRILSLILVIIVCTACPIDYEYGIYFENNSNQDVYAVLDFAPTDRILTPGRIEGKAVKAKEHFFFSPDWPVRDSFHVYVFDTEYFPDYPFIFPGTKEEIDSMHEEGLLVRMTFSEAYYYANLKSRSIKYPPTSDCKTVIYYRE